MAVVCGCQRLHWSGWSPDDARRDFVLQRLVGLVEMPGMQLPWPSIRRVLIGSLSGLALLMFAIPNLNGAHPHGRAGADQNVAIAILRTIHSAQVRFRTQRCVDRDGDGEAEFGSFAMLAGVEPCPRSGQFWDMPGLSPIFGTLQENRVARCNYQFQLYLPRRGGGWVSAASAEVDAKAAARDYLVLAWPLAGRGKGAMYLRADGELHWHANADRRYEAPERPLQPSDCSPANGFTPRQ